MLVTPLAQKAAKELISCYIGLDIGGTKLMVAASDETGQILRRVRAYPARAPRGRGIVAHDDRRGCRSYLPWPAALVVLSGVAEVLLGGLLLWPRARGVARWGLIALLIAVFPANLYMAQHAARFSMIPRWALWLRLPLQVLLIAWVWWAAGAEENGAQGS